MTLSISGWELVSLQRRSRLKPFIIDSLFHLPLLIIYHPLPFGLSCSILFRCSYHPTCTTPPTMDSSPRLTDPRCTTVLIGMTLSSHHNK